MNNLPLQISIVSPVFNEAQLLPQFFVRMREVRTAFSARFGCEDEQIEIVLVNDGSSDESLAIISAYIQTDPGYTLINLSRNFGHQAAITAGLELARGAVVVVMDSDLQDPPEVILEMYATYLKGYDVVYAVREGRDGETWFKKASSRWFYRLLGQLSDIPIPEDTGDFRLMSRRAVVALCQLKERHRYIRGLVSFVGYPQIGVPYHRQARVAGETKYSLPKMIRFAINGVTSFSTFPLRLIFLSGVGVAFFGILYSGYVLYETIFLHATIRGWSSLMMVILLLGAIQLIFIGVIGEYLAQIFNEVKQRPIYVVESVRSQTWKSEVN